MITWTKYALSCLFGTLCLCLVGCFLEKGLSHFSHPLAVCLAQEDWPAWGPVAALQGLHLLLFNAPMSFFCCYLSFPCSGALCSCRSLVEKNV